MRSREDGRLHLEAGIADGLTEFAGEHPVAHARDTDSPSDSFQALDSLVGGDIVHAEQNEAVRYLSCFL